jgi:hypothetical protein
MQEEDDEAGERDLSRDEERAAGAESPEPAVAEDRRRLLGQRRRIARRIPQDDRSHRRGQQAQASEEEKRGLESAGVIDRRERDGGEKASDRKRRLPDAEGEAPLVPSEPTHHGPAARGVDACSGRVRDRQHRHQAGDTRHERRSAHKRSHQRHPNCEHHPFSDPIRRQAPGEERQDWTDPDAAEDDPDARDTQIQLAAKRRCQHGQPEQNGGEARLGRGPHGQDGPSVTPGYSPNGLNGFGLVETRTLFVSR